MSAVIAPPASPFKGLAAFEDSELDALFFFGRERECEVLVANLLAARLTIVYGESGVGKSSLLAAGVVRELRARAQDAVVAMHDTWSGSPEDVLGDIRDAHEGYLILDQFEEYFLYHGDDDRPGVLLHDLPELLHESRVNVLVSLREDALAQLDAFKARIPFVFANQVRLEHLDREAGRAAILGPIARWNELGGDLVEIEPPLVDAVLDEVAAGHAEGRAPDSDRIEAPYLQLVLERIWTTERAADSQLLRLETLRRLGGATTIVRDHLEGALDALDPLEQDVAADMFEHLVTPSGTKIAHRAPDLALYAKVPEDQLHHVLTTLTHDRIVHSVDGSDRYEIFHDVLAEPIRAWRLQRSLERERLEARRRQRRLVAVAVAALVALAIVAGLAVWAFSERGGARSQARHAQARELEARAFEQLSIDPRQSVRLALAATRLEPGVSSESALLEALTDDRLRDVLHAHGPVVAVATSPNGRLIASATTRGRVIVAKASTGRIVRTFVGRGPFQTVGFVGPTTVVAGADHGLATAWNVVTGQRALSSQQLLAAPTQNGRTVLIPVRGELAGVLPQVMLVRAAPDGTVVAAVLLEHDGHQRTWVFDGEGRRLRVLPEIGIQDVAFSPRGRLLATASADGTTAVWNPLTGRLVRALRDSTETITAVAFSPNGALLATGSHDGVVRVWTVADRSRLFFFTGHSNPISAVAWSPDGRVVASASLDRTAQLWGVQRLAKPGASIAILAGDSEAVQALAFYPDSTRLVTGSSDDTMRVWDARPEESLELLGRAQGPVIAARWAGEKIVAGSIDGAVRIWDAATRRLEYTLHGKTGKPFSSFAVSGDGSLVAAGGRDGATSVWEVRSGKRLSSVSGAGAVTAVTLSPRADLAASGSRSGIVRVWDARTGVSRGVAKQGNRVTDLAFAPAEDELATASRAGALLWSPSATRVLHVLPVRRGVNRVVFSPDGRYLATADRDGTARLWLASTGRLYHVFHGHRAPLTDLVFSTDGVLFATSSHDSDGRVWNVETRRQVHLLRGHFGNVDAIAFSPDRKWIATAGPISAGLWPMSTGRLLFYLRGDTKLLTSVSFSPDGRTILSSSLDGTVRTYTCKLCRDLAGLVQIAELRLARAS